MNFIKKLTLKEIKEKELAILDNFASFCDKNNLRYYLVWGTLLGAVRHKGFIPWDDDIDVSMPRPDYEKLVKLLKTEQIAPNISLRKPEDKKHPYFFPKLVDNQTFVEEANIRKCFTTGIWVDIFILDGITDNEAERDQFCTKQGKLNKYLFYSIEREYKGSNFIKNFIGFFFIPILRLFHSYLKKQIYINSKKYDFESSAQVAENIGWNIKKTIIKKEDLEQTKVTFEGKEYKTFKNYDERLKQLYGDYMKLPPENERLYHKMDAWEIEE